MIFENEIYTKVLTNKFTVLVVADSNRKTNPSTFTSWLFDFHEFEIEEKKSTLVRLPKSPSHNQYYYDKDAIKLSRNQLVGADVPASQP